MEVSNPPEPPYCQQCQDGFQLVTAFTCAPCPGGSICVNGTVTPCLPGTYSTVNATQCASCPAGSACIGGLHSLCAPGTYQNASHASACLDCGIGHYNTVMGRRSACPLIPPGFYAAVNDTRVANITPCTMGSSCVDGVRTSCSPGTFQNASQRSACTRCAIGTYNPSYGRSSPCIPSPNGYYTVGVLNASAINVCNSGFFCVGGLLIPCFSGTYASSSGLSVCSRCTAHCTARVPVNITCDPVTGTVTCAGEANVI